MALGLLYLLGIAAILAIPVLGVIESKKAKRKFGANLAIRLNKAGFMTKGTRVRESLEQAFVLPIYAVPDEDGLAAAKAIRLALDDLDEAEREYAKSAVKSGKAAYVMSALQEANRKNPA